MRFGIRQRLIVLMVSGLFFTMGIIGSCRYHGEKKSILADTHASGKLLGEILARSAAPLLMSSDLGALKVLAQKFLDAPNAEECTIVNQEGETIAHAAKANPSENRLHLDPFPIIFTDGTRLGRLRLTVSPANLRSRLRSTALNVFLEHFFIFFVLAAILSVSLPRMTAASVRELGAALRDIVDQKRFTRRIAAGGSGEAGAAANRINYLIERLERSITQMDSAAIRINELGQGISMVAEDIRQNSRIEAETITTVVSSVKTMSSSVQSVAGSAQSLSASAEETSSAMLQLNASNQEVSRHTAELSSAVEDVTTSVMEMIATIREVAGYIETLSSSSQQTAASASEIAATVREVESAAKESSRLSRHVSSEAGDIGVRSIEEIASAMNRIKESVTGYSGLVARLGKRSEEIGAILGVIMEVAEKTNLLALNASILAAQAGEQGRGFAVVAEEIKALADRSAGSAQDIGKLIMSVQKETRQAVTAVSESLNAVEVGVGLSEEARSALNKILASAGRSAETANMIERAMGEQSRGVRQVSEGVSHIKQMLAQIAAAAQAQSAGTDMILKASEEMRDIARQVHNAVVEQERGGKQIAGAAENVSARATAIAGSTRDQTSAVKQILEAMEQMQDLPGRNTKRIDKLGAAVKGLEEQAALLNRELAAMDVRTATGAEKNG